MVILRSLLICASNTKNKGLEMMDVKEGLGNVDEVRDYAGITNLRYKK